MNNPKLTNGLLIALLSLNFILFLGWAATNHRHHHKNYASGWMRRGGGERHNHYFAYHRGCRSWHENFRGSREGSRHHFREDSSTPQ